MELLIALAILQLGDAISTIRFLNAGVGEANPVLRRLFEDMGVVPTLIVSKGIFLYVAYITMGSAYWEWAIAALCAVYAYIVVRNWKSVK